MVVVMNRDQPTAVMVGIVSAADLAVVDYPAQDLADELADSQRFERAPA